MKDYLVSLSEYNTWANTKILSITEAAGEERATTPQKSSFPTVLSTILHILDAQYLWLKRLNGESPGEWPGQQYTGTATGAARLLVENSQALNEYVHMLQQSDLERVVAYKNIRGVPFQNTVWQIIAHVMNHGTYHRGQLVTLFRGAGFGQIEATDLIVFYRE